MPKISVPHHVVEVPPARRDTHDYLDLYWWKHSIYALLEVDVTDARQLIREHEAQTGEAVSFTGYLALLVWGGLWMRTSRYRRTRKAANTWSSSTTWTSSYRWSARRGTHRERIWAERGPG
jgi:hypothetical protein